MTGGPTIRPKPFQISTMRPTYHALQLQTLARADVDLVVAMTFNNTAEAIGVSRAAATVDLPLAVSFTLDDASRLKSGPPVREAIETVDAETGEARPDFYGINCSHPVELEPALESGDPIALGEQIGALARRYPHVDIWGGCCGTWETHLDAITRNVGAARQQAPG